MTPRIANYSLPSSSFPLTITIFSGKTDEILWQQTISLDDARQIAKLHVPGYGNTEHYPVRVEYKYGDGTTRIVGME